MIRVPKGLRWECRGCADCCSGSYDLGPVEPEVVEHLRASRIEEQWKPAAEGPWVEARKYPDGRELLFLRQRNGACVFLRADRKCAVHALLGPEAKPGFCREFPFHFVTDPVGVSAVVRPECGGFHRSSEDGPEVAQAELEAVLDLPRAVPVRSFAPPNVVVIGRKVPLARWLEIEGEALARLDEVPAVGPGGALMILRSVLAEQVDANLPLPEPERATEAGAAMLGALQAVMQSVAAKSAGAPPDRVRFVTEAADWLGVARAKAGFPVGAVDPELQRYLHLLLRSALVSRSWFSLGSVDVGLGGFALGVVVAIARGGRSVERFDPPYREWCKLAANPMITAVLSKGGQALSDLFVHLR